MMNRVLGTTIVVALACMTGASAADEPKPSNGLRAMQCTQDGVAQGFTGKALEDFVAKCIKAKASGGGKDDSTIPPETANC